MTLADAPYGETHLRSLTKGVTWRIIGTADTFLWSWFVTHKPVTAAAIAGLEVFTKVFLFYLHERAWRLAGRLLDMHATSLIKAISWRIVGSLDTAILSWIVTRKLSYAVTIAGAEAISKIVLYFIHERVWRRVKWGRTPESVKAVAVSPAPSAP